MSSSLDRGWALFHSRQYDAAVEELEQALRAGNDLSLVHFRLGFCHRCLGDRVRARHHFVLAIEADPTNAHAHRELGRQTAQDGDRCGALPHFARSLELDPRVPLTWYEAGACLAIEGYHQLALVGFTVCGILCDMAPEDYDKGISIPQLIVSHKSLEGILGIKPAAEIREMVQTRIGIEQQPDGTVRIPVEGFRDIAADAVPQLRRIAWEAP